MNKRELKALCSLTQKSVDELVVSKNIDLRHTHTVSIDPATKYGSDMNTDTKVVIRCYSRYFDDQLDEYFVADDDDLLHPYANKTSITLCEDGMVYEANISTTSMDLYEKCPFVSACRNLLDLGEEVYFKKTRAIDYEDKHICSYADHHYMKTCTVCNKRHPDWMMEKVEGKWICEKCLESEIYATCEVSGKRFLRDKGKYIDGKFISPEVFENHCIKDDVFTHEYHLADNMALLPDGSYSYIPAIEASGNYGKCSYCGKYHLIDQIVTDADGYGYCKRCVTAAVNAYHNWSGTYTPLELEGENAEVFFGIELEIAGNPINAHLVLRELGDIMHCERDVSIDPEGGGGFEIITQPMSWNYLKSRFPEIKKLFKKLSGRGMLGHDTRSCGLHVHVTRSYFKTTEGKNGKEATAEMFADALVNESFSENIQTFARRKSSAYYSYRSVGGVLTKNKAINHKQCATGHGVSVNFANRNTVEFRMFKSTLNPETYMACVEFVKNIVEMANTMATTNKRVVKWHELIHGEFVPNYIEQQRSRFGKRFPDVRFDAQSWNIEEVKTILKFKRDFIANLKYVNEHSLIPISMNMLKKAGVI